MKLDKIKSDHMKKINYLDMKLSVITLKTFFIL